MVTTVLLHLEAQGYLEYVGLRIDMPIVLLHGIYLLLMLQLTMMMMMMMMRILMTTMRHVTE